MRLKDDVNLGLKQLGSPNEESFVLESAFRVGNPGLDPNLGMMHF